MFVVGHALVVLHLFGLGCRHPRTSCFSALGDEQFGSHHDEPSVDLVPHEPESNHKHNRTPNHPEESIDEE